MTPDMKRLREAALRASNRDDIELTDDEAEAIVRAVLTELSRGIGIPLSDKIIAAGATAYHHAEDRGDYIAMDVFVAMINAILAEPAAA